MSKLEIYPQSLWEVAREEVNGPAPKGVPGKWVIHYPGSSSSYEPKTDMEMVKYLRATQHSYLVGRGYSIGYSVIVSQSGSAWAGRGLEGFPRVRVMNPASNPGKKANAGNLNHVTRSIQIAVGAQNKATPEAVATVNAIIATQPDWPVIWHGQIDYTSCAGNGVISQIKSGEIGHHATLPPPNGDEDMTMIDQYRAADTRVWPKVPLQANKVYQFETGNGIPAGAKAAIATVTVTQTESHGHINLAAPGKPLGGTSSLNFSKGWTVANTTFIPLVNRKFQIKSANANTHVVVDVLGYVL